MLLQGSSNPEDGKKKVFTATQTLQQQAAHFQQLAARCTEDKIAKELSEIPADITKISEKINKQFEERKTTDIYQLVAEIDYLIPGKTTIPQIIQGLQKQCPFFAQKINDCAEQYVLDGCKWKYNNLSSSFMNHIQTQALCNTRSTIPLTFAGIWQKTSLKFRSAATVAILRLISDNGMHSDSEEKPPRTMWHFEVFDIELNTTKQANPFYYDVSKEICDTEKYPNQPSYGEYDKKKNNYYKLLSNWHAESQLTIRMSSFPNGATVITYPWGGIEICCRHFNQKILTVNNSIASVCCFPDNKHFALGSYDGYITIIDITQENYKTKHFDNYFTKDLLEDTSEHPLTVTTQQVSADPITHIIYDDEVLFFATKNNIYKTWLPNPSEKKDFICAKFDDGKNYTITAFNSLNGWYLFGTDSGTITLWCKDTNNFHHRIDHTIDANDPISCLCHYTNDNDQTYVVSGTLNGCLDVWSVPQCYSMNDNNYLTNITHIQHDHPIYSVEISPDKQHILVKTTECKTTEEKEKNTEEDCEKKYIDHAYIYSTPDNLLHYYQQRVAKIDSITRLCDKHYNNGPLLYKLFVNNIRFLCAHNTDKTTKVKTDLFNSLTYALQDTEITNLEELKNFLLGFGEIRIGESARIYHSGQEPSQSTDPLDEIKVIIKNAQLLRCAQTIKTLYQQRPCSKRMLEQFAHNFDVKIEWATLLNPDTGNIAVAIKTINHHVCM